MNYFNTNEIVSTVKDKKKLQKQGNENFVSFNWTGNIKTERTTSICKIETSNKLSLIHQLLLFCMYECLYL